MLVRQWVEEECPIFKSRLPFAVRSKGWFTLATEAESESKEGSDLV